MAFCYQCGKPISEQANFCPYCGYTIQAKKVVVQEAPKVEPKPIKNEKPVKGKKGKAAKEKVTKGKGKREAHEPAFDVDADFTAQTPQTVTYTAEQPKPAQPEPVQRTLDDPMPTRDTLPQTNVPTLGEAPHEDRLGWVWIVVGIIILLVVLIVVWVLLFSGYY